MKKIILGVICLLSANNIFAQTAITLNQSSYTSTFANTNDTVLGSILTSTYPSLPAATNASWDMAGAVSLSALSSIMHVNPYTTAFASAQYADSSQYALNTFQYNANVQNAITASAFYEYGEHVFRKGFSLVGIAPLATSTDSLVINGQDDVYSSPRTVIAFPATYHSTWINNYNDSFAFSLTYAIASYHNAPGYIKEYITEVDSVIGWGQMKVMELNGSTSGYMNVLQVKSNVKVMDSFFLNNAPAPSALLSSFNVTQGQISVSNTQYYYRPNEVTPLATVSFTDSTYSTANGAQTHAQRLAAPLGVTTVAKANDISIYPNPVTNRTININMPQASANDSWTYELIDINGKHVLSGELASKTTQAQVQLPSDLCQGIYYISLKNKGTLISIKALDVIKQ